MELVNLLELGLAALSGMYFGHVLGFLQGRKATCEAWKAYVEIKRQALEKEAA